jgi:hypothetical protein
MKAIGLVGTPFLFCALASAVHAVQLTTASAVFNVGLKNQGWYDSITSDRPFADDYATGYFFGNKTESRGFLTFDLTTITTHVASAQLLISVGDSQSPNGEETLNVYDVSTDAAVLNKKIGNPGAIFTDLGSGALLASGSVKIGQSPTNRITIGLLPAGIVEINSKLGGLISFGMSIATLNPQRSNDEYIFTSSAGVPNFLDLTFVPEPSALALSAFTLIAFVRLRRRQIA